MTQPTDAAPAGWVNCLSWWARPSTCILPEHPKPRGLELAGVLRNGRGCHSETEASLPPSHFATMGHAGLGRVRMARSSPHRASASIRTLVPRTVCLLATGAGAD